MATKTQPESAAELLTLSQPLSAKLTAELQERRNLIAAEYSKIEGAVQKMEHLEKLKERLARDIQSAERGLGPEDEKGASGLAGLREQQRITVSRLNSSTNLLAPQCDALVKVLDPLQDLLHRALSAEFDSLIGRIAEAFRPYFSDLERARRAARKTDAIASFQFYFNRGWYERPLENAPRALKALDDLLAGRNPCHFKRCEES